MSFGGREKVDIPDGCDVTQGAKANSMATTDTGTFSLVALFKRLLTKTGGAPNYANGQVTAGAAATLLAARATRRYVTFKNEDDTDGVYIGAATVTSGNGLLLAAGESITLHITTLIQCLAAANTPVVSYIEVYD